MKVLLLTPPFTQLNTPYPATAYLKGFLNTLDIKSTQADLSLEVILDIFTAAGLQNIFDFIEEHEMELSDQAYRVFTQRKRYINTIDQVISFLQNKNQTLALTICSGGYLPEAGRFQMQADHQYAFGTMGTHDKARYLATLYLEDIGDLLTETIDPNFGFSRYAERLARTATSFDLLHDALNQPDSLISTILVNKLDSHIRACRPDLVCITAPFPGNVFCALRCGKHIKDKYPGIKIAFGGGYVNTELRRVYDERVFEFVDFILLDDGEAPLMCLIQYLENKRPVEKLKRTFCLTNGTVTYINGAEELDIPQREVGTPDYGDLLLDRYLSVIEIVNPMHRLWSDGRWNKLTLAHGCYWGKCSFCDVTLDYIKRYEPVSPALLCDRIEQIIQQTGQNGFHFVDEAAPPALMRDLAIEIIKRGITVVWWTNIRFEKSFSGDLCRLLRHSGCIAVSGGLEVASDRLLEKMKKGVTVEQVAKVGQHFTDAGIMVHAYLMYGFPTQTDQETIDSLEMVRQMFEAGVVQSAFWHQFAMTAHSPVGLEPSLFQVVSTGPDFLGFAENDMFHTDVFGADHEKYSDGLKASVFNYMQGVAFDEALDSWFDFEVPDTTIPPDFIESALSNETETQLRPHDQVLWIGGDPIELILMPVKPVKNKTKQPDFAELIVSGRMDNFSLYFEQPVAEWVVDLLQKASVETGLKFTVREMAESYMESGLGDFIDFQQTPEFMALREKGLLIV